MMKASNLDQILNQANEEEAIIIDLGGKNLSLKEAEKLADWLKQHPNVFELNLENTALNSEGAIILSKSLANCTTLHKLNLSNNKISTRAIKKIADVVEKQTNLRELYLNNNKIDDEAVTFLAKALGTHSSLHTLDLSNNLITANGINKLFSALINHSNFCVLNLKNNTIASEGAKILAEKLANHTKLKVLNLCNNQIDGEGAVALAKSIGNLSQLQILDLEGNQIGNQKSIEGSCLLANSLSGLAKLQKLNLCNNNIDDKVVEELANSLKDYIGLKVLNLACNQISSDGITALVQLLENHCQSKSILKLRSAPALEILNLSDNQIDARGAKDLSKALEQYTKLRELDLGSNHIGDEGAVALASLLAYCNSGWVSSPSLKTLGLHNNQISDIGSNELVKILQKFKLENLNLSNNEITPSMTQKISDSFKGNKSNLILGHQSPQIEILPVTYSSGLTEDEIAKITESIEKEIKKTVAQREHVREYVEKMKGPEYTDNKNTILKLITNATILTDENVNCIVKEIIRYTESKNIGSMNIIKNLIQHQNVISSLRNLDPEKSKLFFAQEDIDKIRSLIHNKKLTSAELSKINTDLLKLHSLIDESSNLRTQESNMREKAKTEKVIFILGNTGAGKSTLANLLLEYELQGVKYGEQFRIDTVDPTDVKISHLGNSETQIPNSRKVGDTVIVDCPGFWDTNSVQETANIYRINELCKAHDQIKFALVVTFAQVEEEASPDLIKLIKRIANMVEDIDKIKDSLSLVVTYVDDDSKKEFINNQIDNLLKDNRDLSKNEKTIFEHLKKSVCLFLAPQEECALKATPLFTDIKHGGKYCTENITPLVNIAGKRDAGQQNLANKMINISSNNLNQIVHIIKEAIKHPLQCLDFKNSIFTTKHPLIQQWLREAPHYSNDRDNYNDKDFASNGDFAKIHLLSELKKELQRKTDSDEDLVQSLTNVIRQFQHFAIQEVQHNTVEQDKYIQTLENYINCLQQQLSCIEFFSSIKNSKLKGWGKLQDVIDECIEVNDLNLKRLATAIEIEPNRDEEYYEKALKYLTLGKDKPECKINIAKAYIELGNIYLAKDNPAKAIDCYGEAIDIYPENPEIYQKLGQIFDKAECYKQAIACYKVINHSSSVVDCFKKWIKNQEHDKAIACNLAIEKGDYCKSVGLDEDAKRAYHKVRCLTDDTTILKNTHYKIANILEDQDQIRNNFNKMADEENFYNFNLVDTNFIDGVAETSLKLLGHD